MKIFRSEFIFSTQNNISWFPGHMNKAVKDITQKIKNIDVILEIRDSRIPFSSKNQYLEDIFSTKKRMIIFNKNDLSNLHLEKVFINKL
jgi:ribosome biogenesis GTPase A